MSITPLIICGMGRSGTRNTANVIATHDEVQLFGELPLGVATGLFNLLRGVDHAYRNGYHRDLWMAKKAGFIYDAFDHLGKAPRAEPPAVPPRYVGHKTPHHESLFAEYEKHLSSVGPPPIYFYCARDVVSCWRSYKSMGWGSRTLESFLDEYTESYGHLARMRKTASDRVHVVSLNAMVRADDKLSWYRTTLFEPLGLELGPDVAQRIGGLENRNATSRVKGHAPVQLDADELAAIEAHAGVQAIQTEFFGPPAVTSG